MYGLLDSNQIRWANIGSGDGFNQFYNGQNHIREGDTPITFVGGTATSISEPSILGLISLGFLGILGLKQRKFFVVR